MEFLSHGGWSDILWSHIQALLIFDPIITLWGHFEAPYFKMLNDASVASAGSYVRTCRRIRNSKKIATIRDFHQNICVNPTKRSVVSPRIIVRIKWKTTTQYLPHLPGNSSEPSVQSTLPSQCHLPGMQDLSMSLHSNSVLLHCYTLLQLKWAIKYVYVEHTWFVFCNVVIYIQFMYNIRNLSKETDTCMAEALTKKF